MNSLNNKPTISVPGQTKVFSRRSLETPSRAVNVKKQNREMLP